MGQKLNWETCWENNINIVNQDIAEVSMLMRTIIRVISKNEKEKLGNLRSQLKEGNLLFCRVTSAASNLQCCKAQNSSKNYQKDECSIPKEL